MIVEPYLESGKPLTLFVDIDGPLNGPTNHKEYGYRMKRDCIQNLQYLIDKYEANVCWISSWRRAFDTEQLFNVFVGADLRVPIAQRLPNLPLPDERDNYEDRRGPIIERYCEEHDIKLDEILIIDDDGPDTLLNRWLKVNAYDGLTYSRVIEAERILNGEPKTHNALGSLLGHYPQYLD